MFQGDEVAAVAADTEERALDAMRLIKVEYEPLPHLASVDQALSADAPLVFEGGNTKMGVVQENGDPEAGFKQAAHIVDATYSTHVITHVCLETHGCVCEWEGDKLTAWVSTQAAHGTAQGFAQALNIPQPNVRVITQYMGGGFGSKFSPDAQGLICARLAKQASLPVKLMLDRKEEHLATGNRPSATAHIRAGVTADGKLIAYDAQSWGTGGAGATSNFPLPYIYVFPNRRRTHKDVYINAGQQRAMRAPGHPQGCFLTEILMDELADRVRMDPVEFRLKNLPAQAPNAMWAEYFQRGAKEFGWEKRHATGDPTPGPIKTGFGCSAHQWGGGGRGSKAHCDINSDGTVVMKCGTQDLGTGTRTIVAIVTAETLGLPVNAVRPEIGDTLYPFSGGSGGSTTAASVTPTVRVTAGKALDALCAKVGPSLGVDPETLVATDGRIQVKDNPSKGLAWKDACKLLGTEPISVDGEWSQGTVVDRHERRAVHRGRGRHRNRHRPGEADPDDSGLRVDRRQADRREPGVRRHHRLAQLRAVRGPHPRPRHRPDGQPEHGDVSARRDVGHAEDRHHPEQHAGARRHRHRRAADRVDGVGDRQRRAQRDGRDDPQPAADACQGARRRAAAEGRRDRVKAFSYVNPANEQEAVGALGPERGRILPLAGGMDLLARMKDYIDQPDRIVNVKNALDATIVATPDGGLKIGAAVKIVDLAEHEQVARLYPAIVSAAGEVGTPQIRNAGTVGGNINQRPRCWYFSNEEFVCYKKGGNHCFAPAGRISSTPSSATARATSSTRRASRCPRSRTAPSSVSSVRAANGSWTPPITSRCRPARTFGARTSWRRTSCSRT